VRIKLDQNLPDSVIDVLAGVGHDVDTVRDEGLRGAKDPAVLAGATAHDRLLVTLDRGLGDIRTFPPGTHAGVLVVRLDHQPPRAIRHAAERIAVWRRTSGSAAPPLTAARQESCARERLDRPAHHHCEDDCSCSSCQGG
jgi:predicted nuclease of predicted toxin-antitoxin system